MGDAAEEEEGVEEPFVATSVPDEGKEGEDAGDTPGEGSPDDGLEALGDEGQRTRFCITGFENEKDENLVSLGSLMRFVFPEGLQHPLSTGRLYAFGFYGPLDRNSQLRSGHKGQHVVSRWELDTMCAQFEREDVLQVYILPGRPLAVLSESQQDELIAQADRRIKAQTGKGLMPQVKRSDVAELFDGLKHSEDGRMRFHEMQRRIMDFREDRIKRLKVMYPKVTRKVDKPASSSKGVTSLVASTGPPRARRGKVSPDVAPPEMFQKNKGMNNNAISAHTNRLLSTRAYKICDIESGNSAELTSNVRLIRENRPQREVGSPWNTVSKRPPEEKARLKMLCTLRDHDRAKQPARPWEPTRAI